MVYACQTEVCKGMSMRALLAGILALALMPAASARTILKREPHFLAPGVVAYVDSGQCGMGKILKVTGTSKGISRRKICMSLDPQEATLMQLPAL